MLYDSWIPVASEMGDREEVGPVALFLLDSEQNDTKQDAAIEYNSEKVKISGIATFRAQYPCSSGP
eukprot:1394419-Amorphochlora_amoeboformis.AAC.2